MAKTSRADLLKAIRWFRCRYDFGKTRIRLTYSIVCPSWIAKWCVSFPQSRWPIEKLALCQGPMLGCRTVTIWIAKNRVQAPIWVEKAKAFLDYSPLGLLFHELWHAWDWSQISRSCSSLGLSEDTVCFLGIKTLQEYAARVT